MRGRTAKRIRRLAQTMSVGEPKVAYTSPKNSPKTTILSPNCERGRYQRLKKAYKRG